MMMTTPDEARKALQQLCALSKHLGKDVDLGCVKKLVMFINEVERMKQPQTAALFKPPAAPAKEHPFLQPINAGD